MDRLVRRGKARLKAVKKLRVRVRRETLSCATELVTHTHRVRKALRPARHVHALKKTRAKEPLRHGEPGTRRQSPAQGKP